MSYWPIFLPALSLLVWLYLLLGRRGFWRARPAAGGQVPPTPAGWPAIAAVVPARNEAEHVEAALGSLLDQDYAGPLVIVLIDDQSDDATRTIAERLAVETAGRRQLSVIGARPLPPGWSGKLWAVSEGLRHAGQIAPDAAYLLLTDADIRHAPHNLACLVAKAEADRLDLASLMVRLRCSSFWERLLIPPFVFLFQKLYPFGAVNDPHATLAAAAGGCMLVRRRVLAEAGGIAAIRDRLIDDVALARLLKHRPGGGRIWLGLSASTTSLRRYDRLAEIWAMVVRTADTQLRHSLLLLAGTVVGMAITYLGPPLALLAWPWHGRPIGAALGLAGWVLMTLAYRPTARFYGLAWPWTLTLPAAAALYTAMTIDSARLYRLGRGGLWKGRTAPAAGGVGPSQPARVRGRQ